MFSKASQYAIRAIIYLAMYSSERQKWGALELSEELALKKPFLSKVLQDLVKNKIITSVKGPKGGFYMNDANKQSNLIDVLACFNDLGSFHGCILGLPQCSDQDPCPLHVQAFAYREGLKYQFTHMTLAELAQKSKNLGFKI